MDEHLERVYATRFEGRCDDRRLVWTTLVESYFQRFVGPDDDLVDLAAGHCEFVNAVRARTKVAIDLNPATSTRAGPDVRVVRARSTDLPADLDGSADVVWVSNFFEHLRDGDELLDTLAEVRRVLRSGGRLLVLQPNIRLTGAAYWDFLDHSLPLTDTSLAEALGLAGFSIDLMKVRFLPYTTSSRWPVSPALIRLYLRVPPAQWLLGKQTFVVAHRD